jgi:predicted lipid-binding transport protein (Tim44 family)
MRNRLYTLIAIIAVVALAATAQTGGQQQRQPTPTAPQPQEHDMAGCPLHEQHTGHDAHAELNARGDKGMGFAQAKTTHHFHLTKDGGMIAVEANDTQDTASRAQIRAHLKHIATAFAAGDFSTPMFVHAQTPPGVPAMQRLKAAISYTYEETERGARVRITTNEEDALAAIHEFLRFQIKEHDTGDSLEVVD